LAARRASYNQLATAIRSASQVNHSMIALSLETDDPEVYADLIANNTSDFQLRLEKESSRQGALETKLLYDFLVQVSAGVTTEIVAHYIMAHIAPRAKKLRVNGVRVTSETECKAALAVSIDQPDVE
jgi:hypothetical protein